MFDFCFVQIFDRARKEALIMQIYGFYFKGVSKKWYFSPKMTTFAEPSAL